MRQKVEMFRPLASRTLRNFPPDQRYLVGVSGGRDSMVLLDAFASVRPGDIAAVASFDHGTGPAAVKAITHVERESERRGLPVITGKRSGWSPSCEGAHRRRMHIL